MNIKQKCFCGSDMQFAVCCGLYIDGGTMPETAEQLMRSRYSAYVLARDKYLLSTWHEATRPTDLHLNDMGRVKWLGLKILRTEAGSAHDQEGVVEFVARYSIKGKAGHLHEVSRFRREDGHWLYVRGQIEPA